MEASTTRSFSDQIRRTLIKVPPSAIFLGLIIFALVFFEFFNYSTTEYALSDLLGELNFAGLAWATILALAFCAIDFAGIARIFTPRSGMSEGRESWYLFAAWLIAATMNAALTWWGVSMAITNHAVESTAVVDLSTLTRVVPVFVAILVWVIRILIIGSLTYALDRFFNPDGVPARRVQRSQSFTSPVSRPVPAPSAVHMAPRPAMSHAKPAEGSLRLEPTYHAFSTSKPNAVESSSTEKQNF